MRTVTTVAVSETYDVPAAALWSHVVRYDALEAMMSGPLVRVRCPEGEEQVGHDVALVFRLFGVVPIGRWCFKVVVRDNKRRRLMSEEQGSGVRSWTHEIVIDDVGADHSRLTDTITIDAGSMTQLVAAFARRDYTRRHRLRKRLLERS